MEPVVSKIHDQYVKLGKRSLELNKQRHELTKKLQEIEQLKLPLIPLTKVIELLEESPPSSEQSTDTSLDEAKKELAELEQKLGVKYPELAEKMTVLIPQMKEEKTMLIEKFEKLQEQIKKTTPETKKGKEDLKKIDEDCSKLLEFTQNINLDDLEKSAPPTVFIQS